MNRKENPEFNGAKETAGLRKRMSHNMFGSVKVVFIQCEPLQEIVENLDPMTLKKSWGHIFPNIWVSTRGSVVRSFP